MFDLKAFGKRIKDRRIAVNLTEDELAKMAGYSSRSSINKIEMGLVDVPLSKVMAIAVALDVSPVYLMGLDDGSAAGEKCQDKLTSHEVKVIGAYRESIQVQPTVDRILGIELEGYVNAYVAANSKSNLPDRIVRIPIDEVERLRRAPESDESLL